MDSAFGLDPTNGKTNSAKPNVEEEQAMPHIVKKFSEKTLDKGKRVVGTQNVVLPPQLVDTTPYTEKASSQQLVVDLAVYQQLAEASVVNVEASVEQAVPAAANEILQNVDTQMNPQVLLTLPSDACAHTNSQKGDAESHKHTLSDIPAVLSPILASNFRHSQVTQGDSDSLLCLEPDPLLLQTTHTASDSPSTVRKDVFLTVQPPSQPSNMHILESVHPLQL